MDAIDRLPDTAYGLGQPLTTCPQLLDLTVQNPPSTRQIPQNTRSQLVRLGQHRSTFQSRLLHDRIGL